MRKQAQKDLKSKTIKNFRTRENMVNMEISYFKIGKCKNGLVFEFKKMIIKNSGYFKIGKYKHTLD